MAGSRKREGSRSSLYIVRHSTMSSASSNPGAATTRDGMGVSPLGFTLSPSLPEWLPSQESALRWASGKAQRVKVGEDSMNRNV